MNQIAELIKNSEYSEAIKLLKKLLIKDPENAQIIAEMGYCHSMSGSFKLAEEKFKEATKINFYNPWIWQQYGFVLFKLGKLTSAIEALKKSTEYNNDDALVHHQLAFLYQQKNDFKNSLKHIDSAINVIEKTENGGSAGLLEMRAIILENLDKDKAIDAYLSMIQDNEDEAIAYDRLSSLIIDNFTFSKNLNNLNFNSSKYNEATQLLRNGDVDKAISLYKEIIRRDKFCYPAYLGISQALYEKKFSSREISRFDKPDNIEKLVKNYDQLNNFEKNIMNASINSCENFIPYLIKKNSEFIIAPIDVKLTDFPANRHLKDKSYLRNISYCSLRGIGGDNGYVGIERLRDLLWNVSPEMKFTPACVAHEFGHQVWCLLDKDFTQKVKTLYAKDKKQSLFISNYSSWSVEEYFAEYYAYYTRLISSNSLIPTNNRMLEIITDLKNYKPVIKE